MPIQATTGKRTVLRELIDERGLKYGFVANKIGSTPSGFTRLLNGERTLSAGELLALEALLALDASAFFDGRELLIASEHGPNANGAAIGTNPTSEAAL